MATRVKQRDFYKILIVGQPGKGKTYSLRDLNKEKTGYVNAENKPLPFEGAFKYHARPKKFLGALKAIEDYSKNPDIDVVIVDSMSAIFDMLLEEMRNNFRGFEVWDNYNRSITKLLNLIKSVEKEMVIMAHYEVINIEGEPEKRVKVKGKEHEGVIEKEFTIVIYADNKFKDDKPEFFFRLVGEGMSTKCPPAIFGEGVFRVPNDAKTVLDKVVEFSKKSETEIEREDEIFS